MDIDVAQYIGAVERAVSTREHEGRAAKVVRATRTYDATVEEVWDACTNPERIPRWFLPVTGDLEVGGRFQLEGNAGGEVLACEPPHRLSVTWEYGGEISWLEVRLAAAPDGGTTLELEHMAHIDERWDEFGPGAVGVGWDLALMGLGLHLATGASNDPEEVAAWSASPAGRDFATRSSRGWREASVADGTDEAAARAAEERTTAAYTEG